MSTSPSLYRIVRSAGAPIALVTFACVVLAIVDRDDATQDAAPAAHALTGPREDETTLSTERDAVSVAAANFEGSIVGAPPLSGGLVRILRHHDKTWPDPDWRGRAECIVTPIDGDGRFRFENLPVNRYIVSIEMKRMQIRECSIEVTEDGGRLELHVGAGEINGRLPHAALRLHGTDMDLVSDHSPGTTFRITTKSDPGGAYKFSSLPAGTFWIGVATSGSLRNWHLNRHLKVQLPKGVVRWIDEAIVHDTHLIHGRLLTKAGQPVAGPGSMELLHLASGLFTFVPYDEYGKYSVPLSSGTFRVHAWTREIGRIQVRGKQKIEFVLPGASLTGRLRLSGRSVGARDHQLKLVSIGGHSDVRHALVRNNRYYFYGLRSGDYRVSSDAGRIRGTQDGTVVVEIRDETVPIRLDLDVDP